MESISSLDVDWMIHGEPPINIRPALSRTGSSMSAQTSPSPTPPPPPPPPPPPAISSPSPDSHSPLAAAAVTKDGNPTNMLDPFFTTRATPPASTTPDPQPSSKMLLIAAPPSSSQPVRRNTWLATVTSRLTAIGLHPPEPAAQKPQAPKPDAGVITTIATVNAWAGATAKATAGASLPSTDSSRPSPGQTGFLTPGIKSDRDVPYIPAPPKPSQPGLFSVLRRLSTSSSALTSTAPKDHHGLVERRVLNVDHRRERCPFAEINPATLRKVAFCVDVEIAAPSSPTPDPLPSKLSERFRKYKPVAQVDRSVRAPGPHLSSVGSDATADNSGTATADDDEDDDDDDQGDEGHHDGETAHSLGHKDGKTEDGKAKGSNTRDDSTRDDNTKHGTKKNNKKKKTDHDRKLKTDRKRRIAVNNGSVPIEIPLLSPGAYGLSSLTSHSPLTTPSPSHALSHCHPFSNSRSYASSVPRPLWPVPNPVRIYRRCCQLRESHSLKRISEQLANPENFSSQSGLVYKLTLPPNLLQHEDFKILADFLAVVPVRELVLDHRAVTDEEVRLLLAGLLSAKSLAGTRPVTTAAPAGRSSSQHGRHLLTGGAVETLVLKGSTIGVDGWKHICLFLYMCRSLKSLDLSAILLPPPSSPGSSHATLPVLIKAPAQPTIPPPSAAAAAQVPAAPSPTGPPLAPLPAGQAENSVAALLSKCLGHRLAGSNLELLNLTATRPSADQLGLILDGAAKCSLRRLGLANNSLDACAISHVARYLAAVPCEGLDLGGNDLADNLPTLAASLHPAHPLWALSLANCNLKPSSLAQFLPVLVQLPNLRFIDLSHNPGLFQSEPSAVGPLREYLPQMKALKRIHLANVALTCEQAIALIEILPDISGLAHISLLANSALVRLSQAQTAADQAEACALYASLLTATRLSKNLVCIDIEVPTDGSSDLVQAMAKQVVAHCLRNMERFPVAAISTAVTAALSDTNVGPPCPFILSHLTDDQALLLRSDAQPGADDLIGGQGVVKALACCLDSHRNDSAVRSGFPSSNSSSSAPASAPAPAPSSSPARHNNSSDGPSPPTAISPAASASLASPSSPVKLSSASNDKVVSPGAVFPSSSMSPRITPGRARELSKQLLACARKIRVGIQPALVRAKADYPAAAAAAAALVTGTTATTATSDALKLFLLDQTLQGIIKRFEDEYPETRVPPSPHLAVAADAAAAAEPGMATAAPLSSPPALFQSPALPSPSPTVAATELEELALFRPLGRTNSSLSQSSRAHVDQEGRTLRASHRLRASILDPSSPPSPASPPAADAAEDVSQALLLHEKLGTLGPDMVALRDRLGAVRAVRDHRELILGRLEAADPEFWHLYLESQLIARANVVASASDPSAVHHRRRRRH